MVVLQLEEMLHVVDELRGDLAVIRKMTVIAKILLTHRKSNFNRFKKSGHSVDVLNCFAQTSQQAFITVAAIET